MASEGFAISYALILHICTLLHPFIDLLSPEVDLALDALCKLLLEVVKLVGERSGR